MNSGSRTTFLLGLLLAVLAGWNSQAVLCFDFVPMDDDINIYFNPHLGPPSATTLHWMFTDATYMRRYVPLGWLGFSTVYGFSGLSPAGYHAANLGLHLVNTLLLFAVLLRLLRRWSRGAEDGWTAVCAALGTALWAMHPFRAETVGWASGLLYGLAGSFALLATWSYFQVLGARGPSRWRWLFFTAAAYLASLLSYPVGLGLIGLFLLMDWAERHHAAGTRSEPAAPSLTLRRQLAEKLLLSAPAILILAVTMHASLTARSFWVRPATIAEFGWLPRAAQAAYAWAHYLWQRWWPVHLTPAPTRLLEFNVTDPVFALSALFLVTVTVALCARRDWRRGALLFWLGVFVLLLPLLGFMEHPYFPCDRYDYLPGMVLSAAAACACLRLPPGRRTLAVSAALTGLAVLAHTQQRQLSIWQNMDTLASRMIAASDHRAFRVMQYRGWAKYHAQRGAADRAGSIIDECERTCGSGPWITELRAEVASIVTAAALHSRMAIDFSRAGRAREAREHFCAALRLNPGLASAAVNYAVMQAIEGAPLDALHWYFQAVANSPQDVPAATRRRVLGLLAQSFFAAQRPTLAAGAVALALRENGPADETAALHRLLASYRHSSPSPSADPPGK